MTGSKSSPRKGVSAAAAPSTVPMATPMTSPPSAAENVAHRCGQIVPWTKS